MTDDVVTCGGLGGDEYTVALKCPDCGPRDTDVVEYDRREGVIRVRCPGCGSELSTNGTIPVSRMKRKEVVVDFTTAPLPAVPQTYGEDDGE